MKFKHLTLCVVITINIMAATATVFSATPQLIDYQEGCLMESGGALTGSLTMSGSVTATGAVTGATLAGDGPAITNAAPKNDSVASVKMADPRQNISGMKASDGAAGCLLGAISIFCDAVFLKIW